MSCLTPSYGCCHVTCSSLGFGMFQRQMAEHQECFPLPQCRIPGPLCSRGKDEKGEKSMGWAPRWFWRSKVHATCSNLFGRLGRKDWHRSSVYQSDTSTASPSRSLAALAWWCALAAKVLGVSFLPQSHSLT